jgi:hypothetical protein
MVTVPEKQSHMKYFMEGKTYTIASYFKNPLFYASVTITEKITHCCLTNGGSCPNVMSNIIMEELGLSCTNEN